jgi:hypothetical protein
MVPAEKERPGRADAFHQRLMNKIKDQPALTAVTECIAALVRDSCTFKFC